MERGKAARRLGVLGKPACLTRGHSSIRSVYGRGFVWKFVVCFYGMPFYSKGCHSIIRVFFYGKRFLYIVTYDLL